VITCATLITLATSALTRCNLNLLLLFTTHTDHKHLFNKKNMLTTNAPYGCQTFKDLLTMLQSMTPEQLDFTPTVYDPDSDEYHSVTTLLTASDTNQILDEDHPYLTF